MRFKIGSTYTLGYGIGRVKIEKPTAKGKTFKAVRLSDGKSIHFGDPDMPTRQDNPEAKKNYCSRASGLAPRGFNPNTFSLIYWDCIAANPKGENNMLRVNLLSTINAEQIRIDRTMEDGSPIAYIRNHKFLINEIVLNGGLYPKEENEKAFKSMEGRLFTNGHPKSNGKFIAISNQDNSDANIALESHYMGASNMNVRQSGNDYYKDIRVNLNIAKATEGGKKLVEWIQNVENYHKNGGEKPDCINTSTGLMCERRELTGNSRGKNYTWVATNQRYDHDSLLLDEVGAGGDEISLAVNCGEDVDLMTVNLDDAQQPDKGMIFLPADEPETKKRSFLVDIANKLGFGLKSSQLITNKEEPMNIAQKINELLGVDVFTGNETDEQIVDKFKKKRRDQDKAGGVSGRVEEEEDEDEDEELDENMKKPKKGKKEMKGNSLTAEQIQAMIDAGVEAKMQANQANAEKAEKETIINSLIANAAYSEADKEMLNATPLAVLKNLNGGFQSAGIGGGQPFQANSDNSDPYGLKSMTMPKGE